MKPIKFSHLFSRSLGLVLAASLLCTLLSGCQGSVQDVSLPDAVTQEMEVGTGSNASAKESDRSSSPEPSETAASSESSDRRDEGNLSGGSSASAMESESAQEHAPESSAVEESSVSESSAVASSSAVSTESEPSAPSESSAAESEHTGDTQSSQDAPSSQSSQSEAATGLAAAANAGLYDAATLEPLYRKAAGQYIYPASLTKLVTACTALQYVSPDTVFTVGSELNLVPQGSSLSLIRPGHRLKLRDLITAMLLASGNDAAYTVAVNVARQVSGNAAMGDREAVTYFAGLMNQYVRSIGALDSHFVNPEGWDNEAQYTTVNDLAKIAARALSNPVIREIAGWQKKYVVFASGENITWVNSNALLDAQSPYYLPAAVGLKTGTTPMAGRCLIAAVEKNGRLYIAITAGCRTEDARYHSIHELMAMV